MDPNLQEISSAPEKKLILYSCWESSCSWRVRFALHFKGLPYEYRAVDLSKGEQFSPEFDRLNPLHFILVLVDGDLVIADSFAILMYLEEKYPQNALLPNDLKRKAINFQAVSIVSSSIQPLQMIRVVELLKGVSGRYAIGDEVHIFPTSSKIYESCKVLPAFQASLRERQPDAVL
ncbi:hypothetical protein MKX01_031356 [Papaver californicum]|nr:hypothetical protein MKX01_031356 [Papaver californicum]